MTKVKPKDAYKCHAYKKKTCMLVENKNNT